MNSQTHELKTQKLTTTFGNIAPFRYLCSVNKETMRYMKRNIILILLALIVLQGRAQTNLIGTWSGKLNVMGTSLTLVLNLEQGNGDVVVTLDSPDQGAKGIPCSREFLSDDSLSVKVAMINASYSARLKDGNLIGAFTQNGMSFPLTLKHEAPKENRPQTPKPPFPYTEEEVTFQNAGYTFHGTLTLPEGYDKQTPVLVMVTGSGLQNRDEELMGHRPFAVIADALARHGIATMRYDDRGWGDKSFSPLDDTIDDHKTDAEACVRLMRERFKHVGVIGHSEGGTIALMLASEGKVDFCVSLAGMAVSGKETLLDQNRTMLSFYGIPINQVNDYCKALGAAFDNIIADKPVEDDGTNLSPFMRQQFKPAIQQASSPYMRDFLKTDIRGSLSRVKCPVLALNGKRDTQVNASANLEAIDKGLTKSKHEVVAYDDLNHLFQHCQTGLVDEYHKIEETFAPEVLTKIIEWVGAICPKK